jgi:hypothetical protein
MRSAFSLGMVTVLVGLTGVMSMGSCGEGNPGIDPPSDRMWFPTGVLLDPRIDSAEFVEVGTPCETDEDCGFQGRGVECRDVDPMVDPPERTCWARERPRWLFITNANSDRRFNAGSLLAFDLDSYFDAAFGDPDDVQPAGTQLDCVNEDKTDCCRRVANLPQVVECTEQPFIASDATVHFGTFPGPATAWVPPGQSDEAMVLIPVAGDPSITYVELSGFSPDGIDFECGQASDPDGRRMCDDDHRLRFLRNDPESERLGREPVRVLVSPQEDLPLAYVSHQGDPDLTLLDLEGVEGDPRPAIVHQAVLMVTNFGLQGGWGLAQRPCVKDSDNVPASTSNCERPLVYGAIRWQLQLSAFTALEHEPVPGQQCVGPNELDEQGGIICDPQIHPLARIGLSGLSTSAIGSRPVLGNIAFSRTGNELYVVQSNPGGLIRVDTSLGVDDEPLDVDVGVVEVCAEPTTLVIYDDGSNEYGLVTCYRSGEVFIVDLAALAVVGLSRAGIGPDAMAVDIAREVVYVANSLDATISIIDMSRTSSTRFTEIGRIGLQEPYTQ